MENNNSEKRLARKSFLSLFGKGILGFGILQALPTEVLSMPKLLKPSRKKALKNQYTSRVKEHPLAIKRSK